MNRFGVQLFASIGLVFIMFTCVAALPHTIWTFSTLMNGNEPAFATLAWFGWVFTGALLGVSIDVGQMAISIQLARGERTTARYLAFGVLCVLTFYCQWLYTAAHIPAVLLGAGINANVLSFSGGLRDAGVWLLPASIPFATLIYTFGYRAHGKQPTMTVTQERTTTRVKVERSDQPRISPANVPQLEAHVHSAACDECGYTATKTTQARAEAAVRFHKRAKHKVEVS